MEIKLLIFDFDGVLVDTGTIHLAALNQALSQIDDKFCISNEEDLQYFGTVPTKEKLKILSNIKGFPADKYEEALLSKKIFTNQILDSLVIDQYFFDNVRSAILKLSKEYKLAIVSNTNLEFITKILTKVGLKNHFDIILTNEHPTARPKPYPDLYWQTMMMAGSTPEESLIFEDSITGQAAAIKSGANVFGVESPKDIIYENIKNKINSFKPKNIKWKSEKINVLIPMAGEGSRFKQAGYQTPKPLIDVNGQPMVGLVADKLNIDAHFIFVVKGEHCEQYNLETMLNLMYPGCTIVKAWGKQCGAVCSVLEARPFIDNDKHLLIVNSDQIWDWNANAFYYQMTKEDLDGGIVTFVDNEKNPKWSFAKIDESGYVTEVAEKNPISNLGTAGIYYYKKGSDFVKYSNQMIVKNIKVNNEFYVCPVYNEFILDNKKIKTFNCDRMIGLGIPEDLEAYLKETNG